MKKKNFIQRTFSPTPKEWAKIAIPTLGLATALGGGLGAIKVAEITMPEPFYYVVGGLIFILTCIGLYAQQHEKK